MASSIKDMLIMYILRTVNIAQVRTGHKGSCLGYTNALDFLDGISQHDLTRRFKSLNLWVSSWIDYHFPDQELLNSLVVVGVYPHESHLSHYGGAHTEYREIENTRPSSRRRDHSVLLTLRSCDHAHPQNSSIRASYSSLVAAILSSLSTHHSSNISKPSRAFRLLLHTYSSPNFSKSSSAFTTFQITPTQQNEILSHRCHPRHRAGSSC
jgi:hypothetical protein